MDREPKDKGNLVTPEGRTAVPVVQVNPDNLPSDSFLAQLTDMIMNTGKVTQIVYNTKTEEIVECKEK